MRLGKVLLGVAVLIAALAVLKLLWIGGGWKPARAQPPMTARSQKSDEA